MFEIYAVVLLYLGARERSRDCCRSRDTPVGKAGVRDSLSIRRLILCAPRAPRRSA